jgi:hypothetical protein
MPASMGSIPAAGIKEGVVASEILSHSFYRQVPGKADQFAALSG